MRLLMMTDSPYMPTGLGRLGFQLSTGFARRGIDVSYIGWFHRYNNVAPIPGVKFWSTNDAFHGANIFDSVVNKVQPDVVLTIGDMWNLSYLTDPYQCKTRKFFDWISYIAVDGEPVNGGIPPALIPIIEEVDHPVAYTKYAENAILKSCRDPETRMRLRTIYHGVDVAAYKPVTPKEKREIRRSLGIDEDKFIFITVSRNQSRKNIPELLRAWKIFSELPETRDKVMLWPHMSFTDQMGWQIKDLLEILGLKNHSIAYYHQVAYGGDEFTSVPENELIKLYQMADAFVLISGEGFGMPIFEAMSCGLPCVLLDYAAASELGADKRAELVTVQGSMTWTGLHLTQRPIPDVNKISDSLLKVYMDRKYRSDIAINGHEFAKTYTWDRIVEEWIGFFDEIEVPFIKPVKMEVLS